ncbi:helix-turn-helix transcriptional regulator [Bacillus xiapuensis]|uniref:Helix-turn-helix transcriptional regulator n=1 Tax=Bacillus xiapuensis TaxID=2014075 RepID=A0ABU6N8D2_9BACI|nr:helix-turn-helix transcriptional regulator [Bacillus xiapuensis]
MLSGKELKVKRILLDVEAREIANHIGISKSYISLMEKGARRIPDDKYDVWIQYLNRKEHSMGE